MPTLREIQAERAKRRLSGFTSFTYPDYIHAAHQQKLDDHLEAVERGDIDRLMVFMPPRHGKSEKTTKRFPSWYLGRNPKRQIISASYNSDLAADFGREVKQILASQEYQDIFPGVRLRQDSRAADRMNTEQGGAYFAVGVGTATTGRGAHLGIIDDPFKDREDADSENQRDKVWNWYRSTFYTRLMPGGAVVLVQTRWHEDDLAGRLLEQDGRVEDGGQWTVLELPAIDAGGAALWPEWYDVPALERIKRTIGPREWSALYQQKPQPDEGTFFKQEWFRRFDVRPQHLRFYMTSDHAPGDGDATDWNVFRIWGVDEHQHVYMVDGYRSQGTLDEALGIQALPSGDLKLADFGGLPLIRKWKPLCWFPEDDNNWKASAGLVKAAMRRLKCQCRIEPISPHGKDKATKARAIQAKASMGEVWLPAGSVGDAIIDEFIRFPTGKNDDEVDAASLIGRAIDQAHPALVPPEKKQGPADMWATPDRTEADWRTA